MRPPSLAVLVNDRSSRAKVDLCFLASGNFDATKRMRLRLIQLGDEPPDAGIFPVKALFVHKVLVDPLSR